MTRMTVEPKSCDQGRGKNDVFTHSATLPFSNLRFDLLLCDKHVFCLIVFHASGLKATSAEA